MARAGRRPGTPDTRETILAAAREQFATRGYVRTTIRSVAGQAHVNPALVHHYFGAKERLFLAALQLPVDPAELLQQLLAAGPRDQFAERFARAFIALWRSPATGPQLQAVLRRAVAEPEAAAMLRAFIENLVLTRAPAALGVPARRIAAAASHLVGLMLAATIIGVGPLASASDEELAELVTPAIRGYLG
jgi:AcrR family transcriptional regulator